MRSVSEPTGRTYTICKHNYSQLLAHPQANATLHLFVCVWGGVGGGQLWEQKKRLAPHKQWIKVSFGVDDVVSVLRFDGLTCFGLRCFFLPKEVCV